MASTFIHASLITLMLLVGFAYSIPKQPQHLPPGTKIDKVIVMKQQRKLHLLLDNKIVRTYKISLGGAPRGHKQQQGDSRTPEGNYIIDYRNPQSRFHLSLHISYPDNTDKQRAYNAGLKPGGDIFIHGLPNGHGDAAGPYLQSDWTDGCIAVSNTAIEEIWRLVKNGTQIQILP